MAIGSRAPWTDHEKKVCLRDSATISSLVMLPGAVVMPMDHLGRDGRDVVGWEAITAHRRDPATPPRRQRRRRRISPMLSKIEQEAEPEQREQEQLAQVGHRQDERREDRPGRP